MPWRETCVMNEKVKFVEDWLSGRWNKTQLSIKYGISRPTVDKWLRRFKVNGYSGLTERSCRPNTSPNVTPAWKQEKIIEVKSQFRYWGPKKIKDYLQNKEPQHRWPADSTIGEILKRAGWVKARKRVNRVSVYPEHLTQSEGACHVWNIDFKGDVKLGDGHRCYPLTLSDDFSRYLLCCQGLESTARLPVKALLEAAFREYGQPEIIKSDNGVPFAARTIGGLSQLSIWLIQHGIIPERIDKGKPTQNGRHERLHKTLKEAVMKPPKQSMKAQQQEFDKFRYEYNELRSHESLERQTPSQVFAGSKVAYCDKPPAIGYDVDKSVRKVLPSGEIKWKNNAVYVGQVLAGEYIGLKEVENDRLEIYYSFLHIGYLNQEKMKVERIKSRT